VQADRPVFLSNGCYKWEEKPVRDEENVPFSSSLSKGLWRMITYDTPKKRFVEESSE
jgi:outer membrane protein assembly factor BamB